MQHEKARLGAAVAARRRGAALATASGRILTLRATRRSSRPEEKTRRAAPDDGATPIRRTSAPTTGRGGRVAGETARARKARRAMPVHRCLRLDDVPARAEASGRAHECDGMQHKTRVRMTPTRPMVFRPSRSMSRLAWTGARGQLANSATLPTDDQSQTRCTNPRRALRAIVRSIVRNFHNASFRIRRLRPQLRPSPTHRRSRSFPRDRRRTWSTPTRCYERQACACVRSMPRSRQPRTPSSVPSSKGIAPRTGRA